MKKQGKQPPLRAVLGRGDLGASLLYVFPLFVIYGVGILFTPAMNGADFVSRNLFAAVGYSTSKYLMVYSGLAAVYALMLAWMRRQKAFARLAFDRLLVESLIVALGLGTVIVMIMHYVLRIDAMVVQPALAMPGGIGSKIVLSLGAGVYEELVFRVGLFAGGAAVLRLCGVAHAPAVGLAGLVASALFSAAHHVGAMGDPWSLNVFVYRWLAGIVFTLLFYYRSLAHAVYTHALYDVYVGLFLKP